MNTHAVDSSTEIYLCSTSMPPRMHHKIVRNLRFINLRSFTTPTMVRAIAFYCNQRKGSHSGTNIDAIGSVAFHPLRPLLLSVSGSRHFDEVPNRDRLDSGSDSEDAIAATEEEEDLQRNSLRTTFITRARTKHGPLARDASVKLWSFERCDPDKIQS